MDSFVNEKDFDLLARDPYTFAVLDRILREDCDLILADHRGLIMCHSEAPYPVWIWTPDECPEDLREKAWKLAEEYRPLSDGYRINMKHDLAAFFMKKAEQTGRKARYRMGYSQQQEANMLGIQIRQYQRFEYNVTVKQTSKPFWTSIRSR